MTGKSARREFPTHVDQGAVAGAAVLLAGTSGGAEPAGQVRYRTLGRTGLTVSEVGFGGHSWNLKRVPDGLGGNRFAC